MSPADLLFREMRHRGMFKEGTYIYKSVDSKQSRYHARQEVTPAEKVKAPDEENIGFLTRKEHSREREPCLPVQDN